MYFSLSYVVGDDDAVNRYMKLWIEEAGGEIQVEELEERFQKRFSFPPMFAIGEEPLAGAKFKIGEDGKVSLVEVRDV